MRLAALALASDLTESVTKAVSEAEWERMTSATVSDATTSRQQLLHTIVAVVS